MSKGKSAQAKGKKPKEELRAKIVFPDGTQPVYSGFTISGSVIGARPPGPQPPSVQCYLAALLEQLGPVPTVLATPSSVQCYLEDDSGNEIGDGDEYSVAIPPAIVLNNMWHTTCTTDYTGACTLKAQLILPTGMASGSEDSVDITIDE